MIIIIIVKFINTLECLIIEHIMFFILRIIRYYKNVATKKTVKIEEA